MSGLMSRPIRGVSRPKQSASAPMLLFACTSHTFWRSKMPGLGVRAGRRSCPALGHEEREVHDGTHQVQSDARRHVMHGQRLVDAPQARSLDVLRQFAEFTPNLAFRHLLGGALGLGPEARETLQEPVEVLRRQLIVLRRTHASCIGQPDLSGGLRAAPVCRRLHNGPPTAARKRRTRFLQSHAEFPQHLCEPGTGCGPRASSRRRLPNGNQR